MIENQPIPAEVKEIDDKIRELANDTSARNVRMLGRLMVHDHPTLVQRKVHIFLAFFEEVLGQWDDSDPRIEATVNLAQVIKTEIPSERKIIPHL